jgi:hypothetical protein
MNVLKALGTLGSLVGAQQAAKAVHGFELNDLLGWVGLERRRSTSATILPAIGFVTLGAAIGAGIALLVAPSSGTDLRRRLSGHVDKLADQFDNLKNHQRSTPPYSPESHA